MELALRKQEDCFWSFISNVYELPVQTNFQLTETGLETLNSLNKIPGTQTPNNSSNSSTPNHSPNHSSKQSQDQPPPPSDSSSSSKSSSSKSHKSSKHHTKYNNQNDNANQSKFKRNPPRQHSDSINIPKQSPSLPNSSFLLAKTFLDQLDQLHLISTADTLKGLAHLALEFQKKVHNSTEYNFIIHRIGSTLLIDSLSCETKENLKPRNYNSSTQCDEFFSGLYQFYLDISKNKEIKTDPEKSVKIESILQKLDNKQISLIQKINSKNQGEYKSETQSEPTSKSETRSETRSDTKNRSRSRSDLKHNPNIDLKQQHLKEHLKEQFKNLQKPETSTNINKSRPTSSNRKRHNTNPTLSSSESTILKNSGSKFLKNSFWEFQNLKLLTGSNLQIFGGDGNPAVSITLAENEKPINILTGVDCWLDNLICDIPEVVMYFHDNGFLKSFEKLPTENIPKISNFEPEVVQDLATNIISYLRRACTQQGHTYWMYKAADDDIVKLYDLTSVSRIQGEEHKTSQYNPYTVSVAELLFELATRKFSELELKMKGSSNKSKDKHRFDKEIKNVRKLLTNCLLLLETNNHEDHPIFQAGMSLMGKIFATQFFRTEKLISSKAVVVSESKVNRNVRNYCQQFNLSDMVLPELDEADRRKCIFPANNGIIDVIDENRRTNLENILALEPLRDVASAKTVLYFYQFKYYANLDKNPEFDEEMVKQNKVLEQALFILYEDSIETEYFENAIFLAQIGVFLVKDSSKLWEKLGDALMLQGQKYEKKITENGKSDTHGKPDENRKTGKNVKTGKNGKNDKNDKNVVNSDHNLELQNTSEKITKPEEPLENFDKLLEISEGILKKDEKEPKWNPIFDDYKYLGSKFGIEPKIYTSFECYEFAKFCFEKSTQLDESNGLECRKKMAYMIKKMTEYYIETVGDKILTRPGFNWLKTARMLDEAISFVNYPGYYQMAAILLCDLARLARVASHCSEMQNDKIFWLEFAKCQYLKLINLEESMRSEQDVESGVGIRMAGVPRAEDMVKSAREDFLNVCVRLLGENRLGDVVDQKLGQKTDKKTDVNSENSEKTLDQPLNSEKLGLYRNEIRTEIIEQVIIGNFLSVYLVVCFKTCCQQPELADKLDEFGPNFDNWITFKAGLISNFRNTFLKALKQCKTEDKVEVKSYADRFFFLLKKEGTEEGYKLKELFDMFLKVVKLLKEQV